MLVAFGVALAVLAIVSTTFFVLLTISCYQMDKQIEAWEKARTARIKHAD